MDSQEVFGYLLIKFPLLVTITSFFKKVIVVFLIWSISNVEVVKVLVDCMGGPSRLWQLQMKKRETYTIQTIATVAMSGSSYTIETLQTVELAVVVKAMMLMWHNFQAMFPRYNIFKRYLDQV